MAKGENIKLTKQLEASGFADVVDVVRNYLQNGESSFNIPYHISRGEDSLNCRLHFSKQENEIKLSGYDLTVFSYKAPNVVINSINAAKLANMLSRMEDTNNSYKADKQSQYPIEYQLHYENELLALYNSGKQGNEIAQVLMLKHWNKKACKDYVPDGEVLRKHFEERIRIENIKNKITPLDKAYEQIKKSVKFPLKEKAELLNNVSNDLINAARFELAFGGQWVAYNQVDYFLTEQNVLFFNNREDALQHSQNNISDFDDFAVIHATNIREFTGKMQYGEAEYLHQHNYLTSKFSVMNNENLQYLKDNIKYMGFGESLHAELEKNMSEGKADFQLNFHAEISKKDFNATLNFRKSDSTEMYFFNNYNASLQRNNGEKVDMTFYLNKGKGITAKEAFNLLDGRSVLKDLTTKEGQPYKAWVQIDFENKNDKGQFEMKQFHENYGYDLKEAVGKFAVYELKYPDKEADLMQSLKKGNVQSVTIEKDGSSHKMFIEADPQFKKVNLYDSSMKLVAKESLEQYKTGIEKGAKEVKEEVATDKKKDLKQEVKPEKKNDKSLLPKKRESSRKGLGVS